MSIDPVYNLLERIDVEAATLSNALHKLVVVQRLFADGAVRLSGSRLVIIDPRQKGAANGFCGDMGLEHVCQYREISRAWQVEKRDYSRWT